MQDVSLHAAHSTDLQQPGASTERNVAQVGLTLWAMVLL